MTTLEEALSAELAAWEAAGLRRELRGLTQRADFVTNDTLSLSQHPRVIEAARSALAEHGAGGRAAPLLGGGSPLDREAEQAAAEWLGAEAALLFPSGYQANVGLVPALAGRGDVVFSDERCHASLVDGARLSRARVVVFRHDDPDHLAQCLRAAHSARRRLVLTEGIFSMDGDAACLPEIAAQCAEHGASLLVDEAHAAGLVGPQGAGAWAAAVEKGDVDEEVLVARIVTGGKALGVAGAFVLGTDTLREYLLHRGRSFVFSTGVSPAVAGALVAAIGLCRDAQPERARLRQCARQLATALGLPEPAAAIVPIPVGDDRRAVACAEALQARGLEVRAVRPPTVPVGTARLRISLHAQQRDEDLESLIQGARELGLPTPAREPVASAARPLFVVGTDTGVGKTVAAAILVRAAARTGAVRYWKPVQTGSESDTAEVRRLTADTDAEYSQPAYSLALPASPHEAAAAEGRQLSSSDLDRRLTSELELGGVLVVELAGGLAVPITEDFLQLDWLALRRPPLVLVARSCVGTLNHTLLSLEALETRGLTPRAILLVGPPHRSNRETLERRTRLVVIEVPPFEPLEPAALDTWLAGRDLDTLLA